MVGPAFEFLFFWGERAINPYIHAVQSHCFSTKKKITFLIFIFVYFSLHYILFQACSGLYFLSFFNISFNNVLLSLCFFRISSSKLSLFELTLLPLDFLTNCYSTWRLIILHLDTNNNLYLENVKNLIHIKLIHRLLMTS